MRYLIVVNGFAGSGKDTFCGYCEDHLYRKDKITLIKHSSDFAKTILFLMGWDGKKTPETRKLLADIVAFGESTGSNLKELFGFIDRNEKLDVIFYHERNPKEIKQIVDYYKCDQEITVFTLFVKRDVNEAEKDRWGIQNFNYDIEVLNDGTLEDLEKAAKDVCDFWLKGE